ncbi:MAG TPA: magnesium transporter, partial [Myxococcota bacterium]|nr:magnesium transporter [Myxococcota bacterium]
GSERAEGFRLLPRTESEEFFSELDAHDLADLISALPAGERRSWMRLLAPDDAADVLQAAPEAAREGLMGLLDEPTRKEVTALLAYAEDDAGGLMNPRYARVRPNMSVDEAISYLRKQTRDRVETMYYVYVLDSDQVLQGVVSFRDLFSAQGHKKVREVMHSDLVTAHEQLDQEAVSRLFSQHSLVAIPVVDSDGHMKGIVTVDDIVDVVHEEASEDMQKFGGMEALEQPYLQIALRSMIKKRAGWLSALFIGEMLTATALGFYEAEIARAVVLALFMPLIISSGGNSGSQASTLVIRAMALGEVRLLDWWRVVRREVAAGLSLGFILGLIGLIRVVIWGRAFNMYGEHYVLVGLTVAGSLLGVVMFGTLAGSMLPFLLRRLGFDPASASAPFVATLVDVTGLIIYFSVASVILGGTLL